MPPGGRLLHCLDDELEGDEAVADDIKTVSADGDGQDPDDVPTGPGELDAQDAESRSVRHLVGEMKEFAGGLTVDDLRNGQWFSRLLSGALRQYREKVDSEYFERRYPGMPRDAVVDARIRLAARYAAIEGGLSASAYTGAVAATIGTAGGASPITGSAALLSFSVDLFATTTLQLRMAHDIAVLYRIPIDFADPEDVWRFIRTAFVIRVGETAETAVAKLVPVFLRPLIKKFYSGSVLAGARTLPVIGKHLLQRNVIKFAIPAVGIPASTLVNHWTTRVAGNHARHVYRTEAGIREQARRLVKDAPPHRAPLWVAWLVMTADAAANETETTMMRHLIESMSASHGVRDAELGEVITVDRDFVWELVGEVDEGRSSLHRIGVAAAEVDGAINAREQEVLAELAARCA